MLESTRQIQFDPVIFPVIGTAVQRSQSECLSAQAAIDINIHVYAGSKQCALVQKSNTGTRPSRRQ